jgi:glutamate dehydrogenase/leucine dehydrogenase
VAHVFGSPKLDGREVMVQGVGAVGGRLVELLVADGAKVVVSDVAQDRVRELAERLGVRAVKPGEEMITECDVLAPCALGGVLNEETIGSLRCPIVAGAANNQLRSPEDADRLRAAGILYAPDYVINSGGAFHLIGLEALGWPRLEVDRRLVGIGDTLAEIYRRAHVDDVSTETAAERLAQARLTAAQPPSPGEER